jgi:putative flippase GtrA
MQFFHLLLVGRLYYNKEVGFLHIGKEHVFLLDQELLRPSLKEGGVKATKSYDLDKLIYVGFFGGILPVLALGTVNAVWLRADKKRTMLLLTAGLTVLAGRFAAIVATGEEGAVFVHSRLAGIVMAFVYRFALKKRYRLHTVLQGEHKSMAKAGLVGVVAGFVAEAVLIRLGEGIHHVTHTG